LRIKSIRIQNYRSFLDSGKLSFSAGFNLVVGANNVGKSSLLECLAAKFGGEPHRSIHMLPTRDETLNPFSRVDFEFAASGEEIRLLLLNAGNAHRNLPWPADLPFDGNSSAQIIERVLVLVEYPATRLYPPLINGTNRPMLRISINAAARTVTPVEASQNQNPDSDVGLVLGQVLVNKVYRFQAARVGDLAPRLWRGFMRHNALCTLPSTQPGALSNGSIAAACQQFVLTRKSFLFLRPSWWWRFERVPVRARIAERMRSGSGVSSRRRRRSGALSIYRDTLTAYQPIPGP
jgi:AAA domain